MEKIERLSNLSKLKKIDFKTSSGQENSNFEFLLKRCGHNSYLSALKYPRTNKMKQFFSRENFWRRTFRWTQKRSFGKAPEKTLAGFWKKTWIKHRKSWKKKGNSLKIKCIYTSHFSSEKDQSSFDNVLKKFGRNSVLSLLKIAKTIKIFFKKLRKILLPKKNSCD